MSINVATPTLQSIQKILVPVDFSDSSEAALALANGLPGGDAAELHLLHVAPPGNPTVEGDPTLHERNRQAANQLQQCLPPETELARQVRRAVCEGQPHSEICHYAERHDIDIVVMGTRGRGGVAHLILGSVAERVLRQAPCPVLVVRSREDSANDAVTAESEDAAEPSSQAALRHTIPAIDLIQRAVALRATDIHIDSMPDGESLVRFRIDGRLESYCELDEDIADHLSHQLKNLANLDLADPFHPQESRLRLPPELENLEIRLTSAPAAGGQALALRLFDREQVLRPLSQLGLDPSSLALISRMQQREEGLILVTGPTGSGKTTTVYSMLQELRDRQQNIVSVEDPVEFTAPFIRQMSVDPRHGISLSSGLRTMLRMDPDILFLGEIRDPEAAEITMRAVSSGKYVFSTLHTRDVAATINTLRDMHLEDLSLAGNLGGIINQRLVRRLCCACRQFRPISDEVRDHFLSKQVEPPEQLAFPQGCPECRETGYRGRTGVFEIAVVDQPLSEAIGRGATLHELRDIIRAAGVPSIECDALMKVGAGVTSYQEARRMRWL